MVDVATEQHGVIARRQLVELGYGRGWTNRRLSNGYLQPLYPGVYSVGHRSLGYRGRWMAAALACGPDAVLSHLVAAAIWDLRRFNSGRIDVTVPASRRRVAGLTLHRTRSLHPDDVACREGFPVTSAERTQLDLAAILTVRDVERAFEQALRIGVIDMRRLGRLLDRSRGRKGARKLRTVIAGHIPAAVFSREELERLFLDLLRRYRLPLPAVNVSVAGYEVDAFWPAYGLIVELDGYETHGGRRAFEEDHVKTGRLQFAGYTVIRITWRMLNDDPAGVAALLQAHFARYALEPGRR